LVASHSELGVSDALDQLPVLRQRAGIPDPLLFRTLETFLFVSRGSGQLATGKWQRATQKKGLVLVVGGVGGLDLCGFCMRRAVKAAGLPYAVEVVVWGHGFGRWYSDLSDVAHLDRQAERVAGSIRGFRAEHPGQPVFVVGKSGGAGIAVKALERLDLDSVERAVLLAPALSPRYDLARALRAVHRELVVFTSPLDMVILGAGTRLFGTIDRVRTVGAGLVGFAVPGPGEPDEERRRWYAKLRHVRWRPRMLGLGHLGGHFGTDQPWFLREHVVPLLRADESAEVGR
jgi:pimeloyl-ACP methyl ester carboxylesterase